MDRLPSPPAAPQPPASPAIAVDRPTAPDGSAPGESPPQSEFALLVDEYADPLVRYAFRLVRNAQDAEDVVQDVFARLFTGDRQEQVTSVGPYLYRAVGNACTDLLRRRSRSAVVHEALGLDQLPTSGPDPPDAAHAADAHARAEALLARLPPEQAEAIRLRVFDGLRLDQIAEVLGCPVNTVSSRLRYGFQKLRDAVGKIRSER